MTTAANLFVPQGVIGLVTGDLGDIRTFTLHGVSDLSAGTAVHGSVWKRNTTKIDLTGVFVDKIACTVSIDFSTGFLATPVAVVGELYDDWYFQINVLFGTSPDITWPNLPPPLTVRVSRQG